LHASIGFEAEIGNEASQERSPFLQVNPTFNLANGIK